MAPGRLPGNAVGRAGERATLRDMTNLAFPLSAPFRRRALRALLAATSLAVLAGCDSLEVACLLPGPILNTTPEQITVAPGDSGIVTAAIQSPASSACDDLPRTPRGAVTWESADPAIAAVIPLDSLRARVKGVARGQTRVTARVVGEGSIFGSSTVVVP